MAQATENFKQQLRASFDALSIGQVFTWRRTFTEGDVALFCGVTGDYNPYHVDDAFVGESWFGRRIIPGLLTGSMLTHLGGMLSFLATEMHFQFVAPVFIGDTVTCTMTVTEKDATKRTVAGEVHCTNQHGEEVLLARFGGFPGNIRLAR